MKYLVIMSNCDEQQTLIDFSDTATKEQAIAEHMEARDDVCHAEAFTSEELRNLVTELDDWEGNIG